MQPTLPIQTVSCATAPTPRAKACRRDDARTCRRLGIAPAPTFCSVPMNDDDIRDSVIKYFAEVTRRRIGLSEAHRLTTQFALGLVVDADDAEALVRAATCHARGVEDAMKGRPALFRRVGHTTVEPTSDDDQGSEEWDGEAYLDGFHAGMERVYDDPRDPMFNTYEGA